MKKKKKILIVGTERKVGNDLERILTKLNYEVIGVLRSGEEAIQKAVEIKPNLILMEIILDGKITGVEAAAQIKNKTDIPIIFIDTNGNENNFENLKSSEPYGYITKPFNQKTLHYTIEIALLRHQLNKKHMHSEENYKELIALLPIAIVINSGGKVDYSNAEAVKLLGAESETDIVDKPTLDFFHHSYRDFEKERTSKVFDNQERLYTIQEKFKKLDGDEIDVEISAIPTKFEDRNAELVVLRDISDVKKKERIHQTTIKILQSVELSDSVVQQYGYLYKTLRDFMGINNIKFSYFDRNTNVITFPFYVDEFIGEIPDREFGKGLIEYTINSARTQYLTKNSIENLIKSNSIFFEGKIPLVWIGVPLILDDNITIVVVFKEYSNELKLTEKKLELINLISLPLTRAIERRMIKEQKEETLEKLEELVQMKDNFFSIISHDLRSPFDSILGFTEILKNEYEDLTNEEIKLYLDSLYQTSRHIYSLLTNLLQYSRFQLGKIDFVQKSLKINSIIEKLVVTLEGSALKKEIAIKNSAKDDLTVYADEDMMNSIILNLITNAIKFTNRGGVIEIAAKKQNGFIEISVKDNGIGMDENMLQKIFKLDNKKSTPGTENELGTGIGLLIVKQFIEKQGGKISVSSKPSEGSNFTFTVPSDIKFYQNVS